MLAIFKREFKSYFQNVIGWLFVAALLAVYGLYFLINDKNVCSNGTQTPTNSTHRYSCLATTLTCTSATLTGTWLIRTTMSTLLRCLQ